MKKSDLPDVFETASRAQINQRCADAYLHDIRGSLQAVFSAMELLGRAAKHGAPDAERIDKACVLAKRAIANHEKAAVEAVQLLTQQPTAATVVDLGVLVAEVVHFLRQYAAHREVSMKASVQAEIRVLTERGRMQSMIAGVLLTAIEAAPSATEIPVSVGRMAGEALLVVGSACGYAPDDDGLRRRLSEGAPWFKDLTVMFARRFLAANGGRLTIDVEPAPSGSLRIWYPAVE